MNAFYDRLLETLRQDQRFFSSSGEFLRSTVYEAAMGMDPALLRLLLEEPELKSRFFTEVEGVCVFDKVGFSWVIANRNLLPDSYTRYRSRIGLADSRGDFLCSRDDVELVFPFKDCVLEGGQDKKEQKRDEVFYNETLAPDQVDRLLEPKVLGGARRYRAGREEPADGITEEDNLLIKGNNLLALASLLPRYRGKVKCIYIDPPYYFAAKRDEDTFAYNVNFKLSSWLVFMRNRLELARELLRDDGAIFVQISDDGVAELHRLLKEIFNRPGENNFINKITVKTKSPSGFATVNAGVFETAEYILAFAKHKAQWTYHPQYVRAEYDTNYKWIIPNIGDPCERWEIRDLQEYLAVQKGYAGKKEALKELGPVVLRELAAAYALEHPEQVFRYTAIGANAGREVLEARDRSAQDPHTVLEVRREGLYDVYICGGQEMTFYTRKVREIDGERVPSMQLTNIWTDTPYEGIAKEGRVTLKGGKKPERLLRRIIEMSTDPGDLVLDYHMGSGTTCAVAHKLGRRYIGVEQLDYGDNDSLRRLRGVVDGDTSGISKAVGWKGGGSFVSCRLLSLNQAFADRIGSARRREELASLWKEIAATGFVSCRVRPQDIDPEAEDFASLRLQDQKRLLLELLDKNMLYVNRCDMEDAEFAVSEEDRGFTRCFYGEETEHHVG